MSSNKAVKDHSLTSKNSNDYSNINSKIWKEQAEEFVNISKVELEPFSKGKIKDDILYLNGKKDNKTYVIKFIPSNHPNKNKIQIDKEVQVVMNIKYKNLLTTHGVFDLKDCTAIVMFP